MQAYPRQKGLPRPYNLQFNNPTKNHPVFKYLNTPIKRFFGYFVVLSFLGLLIYIGAAESRIKDDDITHGVDHEKMELLRATKLAAHLEKDMDTEDEEDKKAAKNAELTNNALKASHEKMDEVKENRVVSKTTSETKKQTKVLQPPAPVNTLL